MKILPFNKKNMKKWNYYLFIDDERLPVEKDNINWKVVRSYQEWVNILNEEWFPKHIQFDHDLWEWPTWYDFAKYIVELDMKYNIIDETFSFDVHSQNPVWRNNIIGYLNNYLKFKNNK